MITPNSQQKRITCKIGKRAVPNITGDPPRAVLLSPKDLHVAAAEYRNAISLHVSTGKRANGSTGTTLYHVSILKRPATSSPRHTRGLSLSKAAESFVTQLLGLRWGFESTSRYRLGCTNFLVGNSSIRNSP